MLVQILGHDVLFSDLTTYFDVKHYLSNQNKSLALHENSKNEGHKAGERTQLKAERIAKIKQTISYCEEVIKNFQEKYPVEVLSYIDNASPAEKHNQLLTGLHK